jgi:nucleotide-binding universal stress UspA family protein
MNRSKRNGDTSAERPGRSAARAPKSEAPPVADRPVANAGQTRVSANVVPEVQPSLKGMKTILAPIDFSAISRQVVNVALELAHAFKGRVVLLHSVQPAPIIATDLAPLVGAALRFTEDVQKAAIRHLHRIQHDRADSTVPVRTVCAMGYPVAQILAEAKKSEASYIVIGSHGHTAFHDLVAGSTASGVLKRATCPVVVVPSQKKGKVSRTPSRAD